MLARLKHGAAITLMGTLLACGGHTPTTPSSPQAPTTLTLSGQVIDSATRMGISDASVSITDGPDAGKWAMTDASGNYRLADLREAEFIVMAHAPHYISQSKSVTLTSNQTLSFALVSTASPPHPAGRRRGLFPILHSHPGQPGPAKDGGCAGTARQATLSRCSVRVDHTVVANERRL
jgi:hypothetical protein